ncbi:Phosphoribosyl-ATP pyrophosphohydrolase [Sesbania bispinosa]|nr:Phosphoribosyl-ATP pyrophosphohydrolase [Sesbania bispinosa]
MAAPVSCVHMLQSATRIFHQGNVLLSAHDCSKHSHNKGVRHRVLASAITPRSTDRKLESLLDSVKWDNKGLAVAIAQNVDTGAILMQGFTNRDALTTTISSRKATFYNTKEDTSNNNVINVHDIFLDCDRDSIIYLGKPEGPSCHTGSETCYNTSVFDLLKEEEDKGDKLALTSLFASESRISERIARRLEGKSPYPWTLRNNLLLCSKIKEDADELCKSLKYNYDRLRSASMMADLLYHGMVLLALKDVKVEEALQIFRRRYVPSHIEEKRSCVSQKSGEH